MHTDVPDPDLARILVRRICDLLVIHPPSDASIRERLSRISLPRLDPELLVLTLHRLEVRLAHVGREQTVRDDAPVTGTPPESASEWMARSYSLQSRSDLKGALEAARAAVKKSPEFGPGWIRVAELEFSFGRTDEALAALDRGLSLSPRQAQGLALKGFVLASQRKYSQALEYFNRAVATDVPMTTTVGMRSK